MISQFIRAHYSAFLSYHSSLPPFNEFIKKMPCSLVVLPLGAKRTQGGMLKSCGGDVVVGSCTVLVELKSGVSQAQGSWIGVGLAGVQYVDSPLPFSSIHLQPKAPGFFALSCLERS